MKVGLAGYVDRLKLDFLLGYLLGESIGFLLCATNKLARTTLLGHVKVGSQGGGFTRELGTTNLQDQFQDTTWNQTSFELGNL